MNIEKGMEIFLLYVLPTIMFLTLVIGIRIDYCKRRSIKVKGKTKSFNCFVGKSYPKSITKISNNNNYTEADMEYLQGRELSG